MPTKDELQTMLDETRAELEKATAAKVGLVAELEAARAELVALNVEMEKVVVERDEAIDQVVLLMADESEPAIKPPRSCINCGRRGTVEVLEDGRFYCTSCKHTWTTEEEQAPFRSLGR